MAILDCVLIPLYGSGCLVKLRGGEGSCFLTAAKYEVVVVNNLPLSFQTNIMHYLNFSSLFYHFIFLDKVSSFRSSEKKSSSRTSFNPTVLRRDVLISAKEKNEWPQHKYQGFVWQGKIHDMWPFLFIEDCNILKGFLPNTTALSRSLVKINTRLVHMC